MKVINIIIILLLICFIGLNVYYAVYVQKNNIQNKMNVENFALNFLSEYKPETKNFANFAECNKTTNPDCTSTVLEFEKYNSDLTKPLDDSTNTFYSKYSKFETEFKYNNLISLNNGYRYYNDVMLHKPLLTYRCLNKSPLELKRLLDQRIVNNNPDVFPYIYKKIYIHNEEMLVNFIKEQIRLIITNSNCNKFNSKYTNSTTSPEYCNTNLKLNKQANLVTEEIYGPIYISISQAPYLRTGESGETIINARYDVINNERAYYVQDSGSITKKETDGPSGPFSSLYGEILIIFPLYELSNITDSKGKITHENMKHLSITSNKNRLDDFLSFVNQYATKSNLCALKCNKSPYYCGCLNAEESDMNSDESVGIHDRPYIDSGLSAAGIKKYKSVCYNVVNSKNELTNYSMLYYLNPYNGNFSPLVSNFIR